MLRSATKDAFAFTDCLENVTGFQTMANSLGGVQPPYSQICDCANLAIKFLNRDMLVNFRFCTFGYVKEVLVSYETDEPTWHHIGESFADAETFLRGVDFAKGVLS